MGDYTADVSRRLQLAEDSDFVWSTRNVASRTTSTCGSQKRQPVGDQYLAEAGNLIRRVLIHRLLRNSRADILLSRASTYVSL